MVLEDQEEEEEGKEAGVQAAKVLDQRCWQAGPSWERQASGICLRCQPAEPAGRTSVGAQLAGCGPCPQHNGPASLGFFPSDLFGDVPSSQGTRQESVAGGSLVSALGGQNGRRCHHWGSLFSPPPAPSGEGAREEVWRDQGAVWHPESGGHVPYVG